MRAGSATSLDLLASAPLLQADTGVTYNPGYLYLDSSVESPSWAIFRISGLGTDGSVYPVSVDINNSAVLWLGVSNYERGTWQFSKVGMASHYELTGGAHLVNQDSGNAYILVLASDTIPDVYSLSANLNTDPPGVPTAQVNLLGMAVTEWPASFDAQGSLPGGGGFTEFVYTFDGGSEQTTTAPDAQVQHEFTTTGTHAVSLTVHNDLGNQHTVQLNVEVGEPNRDLLVVYNSDIPEDLDLADYYMSPKTGRGIDPQHKRGLPLGAYSATILRADFEATIRAPLHQFIVDIPAIGGKVKYLLLLKGIPHQIPGANELSTTDSTFSSVDSELCLLTSNSHPVAGWLWNDPVWQAFGGSGYFLQEDTPFQARTFETTDSSDGTYTLDYLVGRLSAYTYDDAKLLVDRSLAASAPSAGDWVVFDSCEPRKGLDTMVDPVWPWTEPGDADSARNCSPRRALTSGRMLPTSASQPAQPTCPPASTTQSSAMPVGA